MTGKGVMGLLEPRDDELARRGALGPRLTAGVPNSSDPEPKAWSAYITLQAPTWTAMASIEREARGGSARHDVSGTVARFVSSAWLSFDSSIPRPRKASSRR